MFRHYFYFLPCLLLFYLPYLFFLSYPFPFLFVFPFFCFSTPCSLLFFSPSSLFFASSIALVYTLLLLCLAFFLFFLFCSSFSPERSDGLYRQQQPLRLLPPIGREMARDESRLSRRFSRFGGGGHRPCPERLWDAHGSLDARPRPNVLPSSHDDDGKQQQHF